MNISILLLVLLTGIVQAQPAAAPSVFTTTVFLTTSYPPSNICTAFSYSGPTLKCPTCEARKLRSTVRLASGIQSVTLEYYPTDEFYDEEGRLHFHGGRPPVSTNYTCSRGHKWTVPAEPRKCWCGHEN